MAAGYKMVNGTTVTTTTTIGKNGIKNPHYSPTKRPWFIRSVLLEGKVGISSISITVDNATTPSNDLVERALHFEQHKKGGTATTAAAATATLGQQRFLPEPPMDKPISSTYFASPTFGFADTRHSLTNNHHRFSERNNNHNQQRIATSQLLRGMDLQQPQHRYSSVHSSSSPGDNSGLRESRWLSSPQTTVSLPLRDTPPEVPFAMSSSHSSSPKPPVGPPPKGKFPKPLKRKSKNRQMTV